MNEENFKNCAYCLEPIPQKAVVCKHCQKSQDRIGNTITWLSSAVGLLTFIGSASLFLLAAATLQWTRSYGADIEVRNVSSMKTLTLFNNSAADVLIEDVYFSMPGNVQLSVIVDQSLPTATVLNIDIGTLFQKQTTGPFKRRFGSNWADRHVIRTELKNPNEADRIVRKINSNIYGPDSDKDGPFSPYTVEAINKGGSDYRLFTKNKKDFLEMPCEIEITYRVARGNRFSLTPDCIGIVKHRIVEKSRQQSR